MICWLIGSASELVTEPGSVVFALNDTLTNNGGYPKEYQALYHSNFSTPFLEQRARVAAKGDSLTVLHNKVGSLGVSVGFNTQTMPVYSLWKNTDTQGLGYVTGLELGTSFSYNRRYDPPLNLVPNIRPPNTPRVIKRHPPVRQQLGNLTRPLCRQMCKHILKISIQIMPVELRRLDQAHNRRRAFTTA